jgi:integrase
LTSAGTIPAKASSGVPPVEVLEKMARRRFQKPTPKKRGAWWTLRYREDIPVDGKLKRIQRERRIAPASLSYREACKIADELLRPMNQGFESIGSATIFGEFASETYLPTMKPVLASSTYGRYEGIVNNYLLPTFGGKMLREMTSLALQQYLSGLASKNLSHESRDKIRDVLSAVLGFAKQHGLLHFNPAEGLRLPVAKTGRRRTKPYLTPEQFATLVDLIPEPYATMIYVDIFTGLRVSELAGLRWNDLGDSTITIDERYCRGDWGAPKSESSNATIAVNQCVIDRIHALKSLTVKVKAGRATRNYRVVKSAGPEDLVFQSVRDGKPIRDNNILTRFIKPAARAMGLPWVNWLALRRSHAVWLKMAGADIKDAQGQMRHSRATTTLDIYQQFVPESQRRVVDRLSALTTLVQ